MDLNYRGQKSHCTSTTLANPIGSSRGKATWEFSDEELLCCFFKGKLHCVEPEIFHGNMALELSYFVQILNMH